MHFLKDFKSFVRKDNAVDLALLKHLMLWCTLK